MAQVLAVFERACNLNTPDSDVIALVTPQISDGPLNIVVDDATDLLAKIAPGASVTLEEGQLRIGEGWAVDLGGAAVWEPCPNWDTLRARRTFIESHLPFLCALGHHHAPANTFLVLPGVFLSGDKLTEASLATAQKAGETLQEGWTGNWERLQEAGIGLAGLGNGLTPAGDDFLMGVMLWAWLTHPTPGSFCRTLLQATVSRTTTLSAAFLRAAARGECSVSWHALLAALSEGTEAEITAAVQEVLACGATSGADTLAGFLYLPILSLRPQQKKTIGLSLNPVD
jgi:hypothetical protein